jgi:hypothetical protein
MLIVGIDAYTMFKYEFKSWYSKITVAPHVELNVSYKIFYHETLIKPVSAKD